MCPIAAIERRTFVLIAIAVTVFGCRNNMFWLCGASVERDFILNKSAFRHYSVYYVIHLLIVLRRKTYDKLKRTGMVVSECFQKTKSVTFCFGRVIAIGEDELKGTSGPDLMCLLLHSAMTWVTCNATDCCLKHDGVVESKWLVEKAPFLHVEWLLIMRAVGEVGASDHSKADTHNKSEETVSRKTSSSPSWPGTIENADGNHDE